ncbi:MAG: hypothetical protein WBV82_16325 [Myxococcaceae bacterium]
MNVEMCCPEVAPSRPMGLTATSPRPMRVDPMLIGFGVGLAAWSITATMVLAGLTDLVRLFPK